jgi:hypothetical protein
MKYPLVKISILFALMGGALYLVNRGSAGAVCYTGMCGASAVASLNEEYFAVADDEQSLIRVYSRKRGGQAVYGLNVAEFLGLPRRAAEVDLEGAARIADRVYWISSHGCNARGQEQPNRRRFFATTGSVSNGMIDFRPVGRPYSALLQDMIRDPKLAGFDLGSAARREPKAPNALNIEGLCATPDGHLLIAFRNPIPEGKALLVPLLNPADVVNSSQPARFGEPILLELGGLGIRSLGFRHDRYWIVGGSFDGGKRSRLYEWSGGTDKPRPIGMPELADLNPEAITFFESPEGTWLWVGSDDGRVKVNGQDCKNLKDPRQKHFRAVSIAL